MLFKNSSFSSPVVKIFKSRIYVLDMRKKKIVVLDQTGRLLYEFARPGEGPEDLRNPTSLDVYADEILIMDDPFIKIFTLQGKLKFSLKVGMGTYLRGLKQNNFFIVSCFPKEKEDFLLKCFNRRGELVWEREKAISDENFVLSTLLNAIEIFRKNDQEVCVFKRYSPEPGPLKIKIYNFKGEKKGEIWIKRKFPKMEGKFSVRRRKIKLPSLYGMGRKGRSLDNSFLILHYIKDEATKEISSFEVGNYLVVYNSKGRIVEKILFDYKILRFDIEDSLIATVDTENVLRLYKIIR